MTNNKNSDNIINDIKNFIIGLKKSFSFRHEYTRELNSCKICGKKSWSSMCQFCEVEKRYRDNSDKL